MDPLLLTHVLRYRLYQFMANIRQMMWHGITCIDKVKHSILIRTAASEHPLPLGYSCDVSND